jgi:hypothetical protein
VRSAAVAVLILLAIGCRHIDAPDEETLRLDAHIDTALKSALGCERGYVKDHLRSTVTATELSDAAIEACNPQINQAVDAYMAGALHRVDLTRAQADAERARMHSEFAASLRSDALRLVVDERTPPK